MNQFIVPLVILVFWLLVNILIINIYNQNKILKYSFLVFLVFTFSAILFYDSNIIDNFLYYIIKFIYFPSYDVFVFVLLVMLIVMGISILNNKISKRIRIINCAFGFISLVAYIIFLIFNVDTTVYLELYSGMALVCLRLVTRSFSIWLLIICFSKYYDYFKGKGKIS